MRKIVCTVLAIVFLAIPAYCQVDTLQAIEVGTIVAPSTITQLYTQDLNGDSLQEVILCTSNHVYVYNCDSDSLIWTSPELAGPTDLQFADIDNDSLLDVSLKDSVGISIFNVFSPALIYATPTDNLYSCYTIGDANDDGNIDLAVVRQEPFEDGAREDSAWVKIKYGPAYIDSGQFFETLINYYQYDHLHGRWHESFRQTIEKIQIYSTGPNDHLITRIALLSKIRQESEIDGVGYDRLSGQSFMVDPNEFQNIGQYEIGLSNNVGVFQDDNNNYMFSVFSINYWDNCYEFGLSQKEIIGIFDYTRLLDTTNIFYKTRSRFRDSSRPDWYGWTFTIRNLYEGNGPELCYVADDSLSVYSIQDGSRLWMRSLPTDSAAVIGVFSSQLFTSPEILIKEILPTPQYLFIDASNHQVNTILPNVIPSISQISDLNHDGNDEILSISGNTLHIYNLEWATPVAEKPILPGEYLTVTNYPNPFNAQTMIKYNLPQESDITIKIYDILGREIESIEKLNQPAGLGQITWDAYAEPSGVYFYRLQAGYEQKTGRMVLLK